MVWLSLIIDILAGLALVTDSPSSDLLKTKPFGRAEPIITAGMRINIVTQALYQIIVLIFILYGAPAMLEIKSGWRDEVWTQENGKHFTIFFNCFVMLQLFNEINCKKLEMTHLNIFSGLFANKMFVGIFFATFFIQVLFIELGGELMKCSNLTLDEHLVCIAVGVSGNVVGLLVRLVISLRNKKDVEEGKER